MSPTPRPGDCCRSRHALESTSFLPAAFQEQVEAVGLEVVDIVLDEFQPHQPTAPAEPHLLIVARQPGWCAEAFRLRYLLLPRE